MAALNIEPQFGLVLLTLFLLLFIFNLWMPFHVVKARRKYKVKYPALYADKENKDADVFNCVQRAHQNCLEYQPALLVSLLLAGLRFPIFASIAGLVVAAGRILYFSGYSTGIPDARYRGGFWLFGQLPLYIALAVWGVELVSGWR
eukprot:jgi/Botrbrau1/5993/Bobra.104_1s0023.1